MPKKVTTETAATVADDKVLITAYVDKATNTEIEEYRWTNRCKGKAEATRQLILKGLRYPDQKSGYGATPGQRGVDASNWAMR